MTGRFLRASGLHADIEPDGRVPGAYILSIGGAEQSHVDLRDPAHVFYEYLRRIANVVDLAGPAGQPLRCLHLGAGALTLARYIQATRPGSEQHAVELERELLDFVIDKLPLPEGTDLTVYFGDARQEVAFGAVDGEFDVIVLDVFAGEDAPAHLTTPDFYGELLEILAPGGVLLVNVGDDPPLRFARRQVQALAEALAADPAGGTIPGSLAAIAEAGMFSARYPGNIVLAAAHRPWPQDWTQALLAAGPHPAAVLTGPELEAFAGS
ncbi:spermidine synthase [Arthrobacter mobilis]|uniref:Fused MFS/spermidine synthase n=1 Tax=Arthrobacter mobilis TaxID=2724944 RepID=A0A7X6K6Q2_9MICC|nr:fused MFS/spermidine synthase [Arthrobacter mobilis]NKX55343.1 fused MFS/spermidine synthase [Arthrobacter mobilis]